VLPVSLEQQEETATSALSTGPLEAVVAAGEEAPWLETEARAVRGVAMAAGAAVEVLPSMQLATPVPVEPGLLAL
jgi:hypothetical protein